MRYPYWIGQGKPRPLTKEVMCVYCHTKPVRKNKRSGKRATKYCSKRCCVLANIAHARKERRFARIKRELRKPTKRCLSCKATIFDNPYRTHGRERIYCSKRCASFFLSKRYLKEGRYKKRSYKHNSKCVRCSILVVSISKSTYHRKYCEKCVWIVRGTTHKNRNDAKYCTECNHCKKIFRPADRRYMKFCSRKCAAAHNGVANKGLKISRLLRPRTCITCERKFQGVAMASICSDECRKRRNRDLHRQYARRDDTAIKLKDRPDEKSIREYRACARIYCSKLFCETRRLGSKFCSDRCCDLESKRLERVNLSRAVLRDRLKRGGLNVPSNRIPTKFIDTYRSLLFVKRELRNGG